MSLQNLLIWPQIKFSRLSNTFQADKAVLQTTGHDVLQIETTSLCSPRIQSHLVPYLLYWFFPTGKTGKLCPQSRSCPWLYLVAGSPGCWSHHFSHAFIAITINSCFPLCLWVFIFFPRLGVILILYGKPLLFPMELMPDKSSFKNRR